MNGLPGRTLRSSAGFQVSEWIAPQIDQAKFISVPIATSAFLFLNRDARIIRNFLASTRECVEERGLTGIRIADEGKQTGVCHGRKFTG